jgi:hypothetical protein
MWHVVAWRRCRDPQCFACIVLLRAKTDGCLLQHTPPTCILLISKRNFIDNTAATDCDFVAVGTPFSLADVGYGLALNMQEPLERDLNRWAVLGFHMPFSRCVCEFVQGCLSACVPHVCSFLGVGMRDCAHSAIVQLHHPFFNFPPTFPAS